MLRLIDAYALNNALVSWYNDTGNEMEKAILRRVMQMVVHAPTLTPPNEALTLDELREMDGEPVYIHRDIFPEACGWRVIAEADILRVYFTDGSSLSFTDYDKSWLAYRRPPEGADAHPD